MKTTIDLSDAIFEQTKALGLIERGWPEHTAPAGRLTYQPTRSPLPEPSPW